MGASCEPCNCFGGPDVKNVHGVIDTSDTSDSSDSSSSEEAEREPLKGKHHKRKRRKKADKKNKKRVKKSKSKKRKKKQKKIQIERDESYIDDESSDVLPPNNDNNKKKKKKRKQKKKKRDKSKKKNNDQNDDDSLNNNDNMNMMGGAGLYGMDTKTMELLMKVDAPSNQPPSMDTIPPDMDNNDDNNSNIPSIVMVVDNNNEDDMGEQLRAYTEADMYDVLTVDDDDNATPALPLQPVAQSESYPYPHSQSHSQSPHTKILTPQSQHTPMAQTQQVPMTQKQGSVTMSVHSNNNPLMVIEDNEHDLVMVDHDDEKEHGLNKSNTLREDVINMTTDRLKSLTTAQNEDDIIRSVTEQYDPINVEHSDQSDDDEDDLNDEDEDDHSDSSSELPSEDRLEIERMKSQQSQKKIERMKSQQSQQKVEKVNLLRPDTTTPWAEEAIDDMETEMKQQLESLNKQASIKDPEDGGGGSHAFDDEYDIEDSDESDETESDKFDKFDNDDIDQQIALKTSNNNINDKNRASNLFRVKSKYKWDHGQLDTQHEEMAKHMIHLVKTQQQQRSSMIGSSINLNDDNINNQSQ